MGTIYNIKYVPNEGVEADILQKEIDAVLLDVNKLMSTYMPDSELSRFNQWQSSEPFPLSEETLLVMREAKRLGKLSGGLLDVTVGPLVNLWGFGPQARPEKAPSEDVVAELRTHIGLDKLKLYANSASKADPRLYVDLSTIAKGYGVDRVAQVLEEHGMTDYLVEIGGEMRLSGKKLSGAEWHNLVSVPVVASSCMTADGLATALSIMGKDKALSLAIENQLAVLLITKEGNEFKEYTSPMFDQIVTVY